MFGFDFRDNKMLLIIIAVLVISNLAGMTEGALLGFLFTLPGMLVAITFHEFAHAWAADKLGDDTPRYQGRLTLNPLKHLDPVGTFLLVFAYFGWGKPVQVNPRNFKGNMAKGEIFVSFAGPAMNFILAIILTIVFYCLVRFGDLTSYSVSIVYDLVRYALYMNIALGVFNLIPLPPLDGSKIFMNLLPFNARQWFMRNEMYFHIAFLVIFITGTSRYITEPIVNALLTGILFLVENIFGIFI